MFICLGTQILRMSWKGGKKLISTFFFLIEENGLLKSLIEKSRFPHAFIIIDGTALKAEITISEVKIYI